MPFPFLRISLIIKKVARNLKKDYELPRVNYIYTDSGRLVFKENTLFFKEFIAKPWS